ncbi:hypothetical protein GALMADRAFT_77653 [Galerina marginata CBS 339.88]|uniref:GST N-terminal domain-containing protein n=1 Tax=Galerina marginata (strain CBS 339.88) TaxID=685588 RepID=A0A067SE39_GALM3|nr:hypothetical protein GALMADRAFT_77653 [Galerina marginata CBS 339.88]
MTIILYDIPSPRPGIAWNPNTWKTRYTLNIKGIPYKTEWVEYCDIEPLSKKLGISPTSTKADGSPLYTLPAIYDPSTKTYVAESLVIAEYLEKTYPDSPPLFPHNSLGLQTAFTSAFTANLNPLFEFILPEVTLNLNPPSAEYFRRTREIEFGKTMEEVLPKGEKGVAQWAEYKAGLGKVDAWYVKNGGKGPFLLGETPSWADVVVGGWTIWLRIVWGEDSRQWKDIKSWHGGRWNAILDSLKKYETIV